MEAEYGFITFEELLDKMEGMVCDVVDRVYNDPKCRKLILQLNPVSTHTFIKL